MSKNFDKLRYLCPLTTIKNHILFCCLYLLSIPAGAQLFKGTNSGFNIGLVSALGNRFQRLGLTFQAYYFQGQVQGNAEVRLFHNFKNLGPAGHYNELLASAGLVFAYGAKLTEHNPFVSVVSNQTNYTSSIGYSYNVYFNKIKTTQQTGIISFQFNKLSIISEDDIFARPTLDRFRTGALLIQYQYNNQYQFAFNFTMWTGQMGNKVSNNKGFPYACYMDTTNGVYTNYSHGLLSGQCKMALDGGQNLQANLGIDAEQVRNFVQNRVMHDMIFLPRKWRHSKNCHIPMLDTRGEQYLYMPGQEIKAGKPYWNLFTGAGSFY